MMLLPWSSTAARSTLLSTTWIALLFNFAFGDIYTLLNPKEWGALGLVEGKQVEITDHSLLQDALSIQLSIIMIILSSILPYKISRWVNIIVALYNVVDIISAIYLGSWLSPYNLLFKAGELALLLLIIGLAWAWKSEKDDPKRLILKTRHKMNTLSVA